MLSLQNLNSLEGSARTRGNRRWGFEFQQTVAPRLAPSMCRGLSDLRLERLEVVQAGTRCFC